jgi:hypothetical protein
METFVIIIILVALAFIPANMAKKKGYSYGGFWVFGFFFWLPAVIVAACLSDKSIKQSTYYTPPYQPPYAVPVPPPVYRPPVQTQPVPAAQPAPRVCAYCGTQSASDKEVCSSCGAKL